MPIMRCRTSPKCSNISFVTLKVHYRKYIYVGSCRIQFFLPSFYPNKRFQLEMREQIRNMRSPFHTNAQP